MTTTFDAAFREAVAAVDSGDVPKLGRLLTAEPLLARERLESPGDWLKAQIGDALEGFFQRPYLLWFIAEDPVRNGLLPANIADIAGTIIGEAKRAAAGNLQEQLDYALQLVCWSWIAPQCGVQIDLIDVLLDAGASPAGAPDNALVNGNRAAAEHLLARGAPLGQTVAIALGRWEEVPNLLQSASKRDRQTAFVQAALHGNVDGLKAMLQAEVEVSKPSPDLYGHATPLHHAVWSGSLDAVRILIDARADLAAMDTVHEATPLGWAEYAEETQTDPEKAARYSAIAEYLRHAMRVDAA
jgi:peptide-methionine (S)-S-oxide reductase